MLKKLLLATTAMFMLFVGPAHAGPLLAGIPALIGGIGASGLSLGGLALGLFSMGAQWLISTLLAPDVKQKGIKTKMDTGGDNPPSFILGEYCTAGQLVYANVWDKSGANIENQCLVYVIQLSCKPVNGISNQLFCNNERVTINTGSSWPGGFMEVSEYVQGGGGGGYFLVKTHDGTQGAADSWLLDKFGSDPDRPWKSDMIGVGCAYVIIQAWYSNKGVWTGLPELRWVVQGSSLYDPRKDSTVGGSGPQRWANPNTWTFSKNPKVIEYNSIRGISQSGEHLWGGTAEAYRLPLDYWFAAMNACDENISKAAGGTLKRYEIGCEIHLDDKPIEIIAEINKSCNGFTTEFGGTYKTWVGGPGLPVGTITDDDFLITAEMETNKFQSQQSTYNTAYGTYPEPNQQWEPKDGPRFQMADALAEDGEELALDVSLPFVSENNQVQRILRAAVKDSRRQVTHEGQLPPKAWVYEPFDVLAYQSGMFGYSGDGKDFIVASKDDLPNVNQRVLLREVDISDMGWLPEYEQSFDTSPLVIVTPGTLVADFTVFPDQVDTSTGKDKPAIRAEWAWAGPELDVRKIDWEIRYPGTTKVIASGSINDPGGGSAIIESGVLRFGLTYEINLMAIPYAIRETQWAGWKTVTCVIVAVPTAPSLTRVSKLGTDGKLSYFVDVAWTLVAQEATYAVKMIFDGQTVVHPATTTPLRVPVAAGAVLTVSVAAVGSDGTVGSYSSTAGLTITKKNTAPTAPTSLTATGKIGRIDYKTNKNPDADFDHFNLYSSNTNDFTTAVLIDDPKSIRFQEGDLGNLVTRYSWITAVDSSGNESAKFPLSNTAGRVATTARVGAADLEDDAVTDAKRKPNDGSNMLRNPECDDVSLWLASVPLFSNASDVYGSKNYLAATASTATVTIWSGRNAAPDIPVRKDKKYYIAGYVGSFTPGVAVNVQLIIQWFSMDAAGVTTMISQVSIGSYIGTGSVDRFEAILQAPATARRARLVVFKGASAAAANTILIEPDVHLATDKELLADGAVLDAKTDQTAPGTPAAPTLATFAADIDGDGTIDTGLTLSVTAPAGVKVLGYEIERYRAATVGGSYTVRGERLSFPAEDPNTAGTVTTYSFKANKSYFWKVRARAIAFNGKKGAWSAQTTTGVSPLGYSATLTASAPAVSQVANGYRVTWTKPTDKAYKETQVSANGTPITGARLKGAAFVDTTSRTVGDTPTYSVQHYDNSDNVGSVSSGTVAPAYRAATSGEVGVLANTNMGAGIVETPALAQAAVTPIKAALGDTTNLIVGNDMVDVNLFTISGAGATFISTPNLNGDLGSSINKLQVSATISSGGVGSPAITTLSNNPCVENKRYTFSAVIKSVTTVTLNTAGISVYWWGLDGSGNKTAIFSSTPGYDNVEFNSAGNIYNLEFSETAPPGAVFFSLRIAFSGVLGTGPMVMELGGLEARVSNNGIFETTAFVGSESVIATNTKIFMRMTAHHTKSARFVNFGYGLKNNSGGTRTVTFEFLKIVTSSGSDVITVLKSMAISMQDDNFNYIEFYDNNPSGDSTDYALRITAGASAFSANARYQITQSFLG